MNHVHPVYDTDAHFKIDPVTREITTVDVLDRIIQGDHNSERFSFDIPKDVDGHDMTQCNAVKVHYINIDSATNTEYKGVYAVDDVQELDDDNLVLTWLVSANATQAAGPLYFLLEFACIDDDGTKEYAWNTAIYRALVVGEGMNHGEEMTLKYADVLAQWIKDVENSIDARLQETLKEAKKSGEFDGADGYTPQKGVDYFDGEDGVSATHKWDGTVLEVTSASGTSSADLKGEKGDQGDIGVGIASVEQTVTSTEDDGNNVVTVMLTNDNSFTFIVQNGSRGSKGDPGTSVTILGSYDTEDALNAAHPTGKVGESYLINGYLYVWSETTNTWENVGNIKGEDGYTPVKGTDYYTEADKEEMAENILATLKENFSVSWNDLNDKPFYTEYVDTGNVTEVWSGTIEQADYTTGTYNADNLFENSLELVVNQKVKVIVNGEEFETTGFYEGGYGKIQVGGYEIGQTAVAEGGYISGLDPTVSSYTIEIYSVETEQTVVPLPQKYHDTDYINSLIDEKLGVIENGTY